MFFVIKPWSVIREKQQKWQQEHVMQRFDMHNDLQQTLFVHKIKKYINYLSYSVVCLNFATKYERHAFLCVKESIQKTN